MNTIALIGCGRIGCLLEEDPLRYKPCTHFGGARQAGLVINYACDINPDRLETFAKKANIPSSHLYQQPTELFAATKPDIVIIATWTESHAPIAIAAARAKSKIIVLEKPIAASLKQSHAIIDACKTNKTTLIINHERRYDNRYRALKAMLTNGVIGKIKTVNAVILTGGFKGSSHLAQGGGPLLHDGTHMIDIIRFLFGEIKSVRGEFSRETRKTGYEDRATAWLKTAGNVDIFLEAGGSRDYFQFELDISGSKGRIVIGNGYEKLFLSKTSQYYTGFKDLSEASYPPYQKNNCFTELYQEVAQRLRIKKTPLTSRGTDGHGALEIIHAIYLAAYKKKIIHLPLAKINIDLKKIFNLNKTN